jgi:hypothetical protein
MTLSVEEANLIQSFPLEIYLENDTATKELPFEEIKRTLKPISSIEDITKLADEFINQILIWAGKKFLIYIGMKMLKKTKPYKEFEHFLVEIKSELLKSNQEFLDYQFRLKVGTKSYFWRFSDTPEKLSLMVKKVINKITEKLEK